jgi:flagellar biosynthesis protein FlhG
MTIGMELAAVKQTGQSHGGHIIAVGGGKGGAGKTMLSANLALGLAERGERVLLVDADLGGANVHTMLGVPPPEKTLSDFIHRKNELDELAVQTPYANLRLISGALDDIDAANPHYHQKTRLLRHLNTFETDFLILDLGAGSSHNIVDFFLIADQRLLVVRPEPTSVENAYRFLKAAFLRRLRNVGRAFGMVDLVEEASRTKNVSDLHTPADVMRAIHARDIDAWREIMVQMAAFDPWLIVNEVRRDEEAEGLRGRPQGPRHGAVGPRGPAGGARARPRLAGGADLAGGRGHPRALRAIASARGQGRARSVSVNGETGSNGKAVPTVGTSRSWYEVLEVAPGASQDEIEKAYKRALKIVDGKSVGGYLMLDPAAQAAARRDVETAFAVLSDPGRRAEFDKQLARSGPVHDTVVPAVADAEPLKKKRRRRRRRRKRGAGDSSSTTIPVMPAEVKAPSPPPAKEPAEAEPPAPAAKSDKPHRVPSLKFLTPILDDEPTEPVGPAPALTQTQSAPPVLAAIEEGVSVPTPVAAPAREESDDATIPPEGEINGQVIRRVREACGVTIEELAERTKVSKSYLRAIEEQELDDLPARVYLRGFLTQIARVLKVDQKRLADGYLEFVERYRSP